MSKIRTIYSNIGVFSSNAPSTGFHFLSTDGIFTSNDNPSFSYNLVFPLMRIIHADYGFSEPRTDIKQLGTIGTVSRPSILAPTVNLNLTYYQQGLINEARLGFVFNRNSGFYSDGASIYNNRVIFISGFLDRQYERSTETELGYPLTTRDGKNIFIATRQDYLDLNNTTDTPSFQSNSVDCFAFGDCYLQKYSTSCSVGSFPQCSVSFNCNNVVFYNGSSGKNIPSVDSKTATQNTQYQFNLPNTFQGTGLPTVLLPKDISIDITNSDNSTIVDLPVKISDLKIQSYDINMDLNREPLINLGYKLPLDYPINLPVFVNLDINTIVGENQTGSLTSLIQKDKDYDIKIRLNYSNSNLFNGTAILYEFLGAKFNNLSIDDTIGSNRSCNFSFTTEINPTKLNKGFFVSGQLGIPNTGTVSELTLSDDIFGLGITDSIITENGREILVREASKRPIY